MTTANYITEMLPTGYELQATDSSKSSHYFYITDPKGTQLAARFSNHEAIAPASRSHVQVIEEYPYLNFNAEMDMYDAEGYEVDQLTNSDAAAQLTEMLGVEVDESMVEEAEGTNVKLNIEGLSAKAYNQLIASAICYNIDKCKSTILF